MDTIRKIETKEYEYIDKELKGYKKAIGFIAQDVQKYFPQAVKIGENNVLTYVELKKYTWKDVDNFYELNIFKKDIPYKIYAFYTLYKNIPNLIIIHLKQNMMLCTLVYIKL